MFKQSKDKKCFSTVQNRSSCLLSSVITAAYTPQQAYCALEVYWQMCPAVIITISCTSLESSTEAQPKAIPL